MIRVAEASDVAAVARLINRAFEVEAFFKIGDRTSDAEVREMMGRGDFFVLEDPHDVIAGAIYLVVNGERGYFGMLSVNPAQQRSGHGRRLVEFVESVCRTRGCRSLDIHIVNLREELPAFYNRLGYEKTGTLPFADRERISRECHFIVMTKDLGATSPPRS